MVELAPSLKHRAKSALDLRSLKQEQRERSRWIELFHPCGPCVTRKVPTRPAREAASATSEVSTRTGNRVVLFDTWVGTTNRGRERGGDMTIHQDPAQGTRAWTNNPE